jgi:hypothetical protein
MARILQPISGLKVCLGSWLCENVVARRADRIDLPSDRYSRREDSPGLSISINQRKIILLVFEFSGFSHRLGQNPLLPRRDIDGRFTSISRHTMAHRLSDRGIGVTRTIPIVFTTVIFRSQ